MRDRTRARTQPSPIGPDQRTVLLGRFHCLPARVGHHIRTIKRPTFRVSQLILIEVTKSGLLMCDFIYNLKPIV